MTDRFLVTGAAGCLGAWTIARLVREGADIVAFDRTDDRRRLNLVLDPAAAAEVPWVVGDLRDADAVGNLVSSREVTHIIHLAALQVPFCKVDPIMGAQVNVTGTVNVFEAARRSEGVVRSIAYASSVAVFGPAPLYDGGRARDGDPLAPTSLYGVYKQANEASARVYFDDWGVSSIGLRPCVIYGAGRDQGMTSAPTVAMLQAAAGKSSHIGFTGMSTYHHADDVAAVMIASVRAELAGSLVYNVGGTDGSVAEIAAAIEDIVPGVKVTHDGAPLALVAGLDGSQLHALLGEHIAFRPLRLGIENSIHGFRQLIERGLLCAP